MVSSFLYLIFFTIFSTLNEFSDLKSKRQNHSSLVCCCFDKSTSRQGSPVINLAVEGFSGFPSWKVQNLFCDSCLCFLLWQDKVDALNNYLDIDEMVFRCWDICRLSTDALCISTPHFLSTVPFTCHVNANKVFGIWELTMLHTQWAVTQNLCWNIFIYIGTKLVLRGFGE